MKRQIRNAIASLVITAFVGIGLMAFGQDPCCPQPACPAHPVVVQPVAQPVAQPVVIQTVEQTVQQPVVTQTVEQTCIQPVAVQPVAPTCVQPVAAPAPTCADLCDLVRSIEKHADHLRKDFKDSLDCLDCVDDSYYDSVKAFEKATDRLKRHYRDDCDSCDIAADVQEVLSLANCISAYMDPCSLCPEAIEEWAGLQADLQQLAGQFCTVASFQPPISLQPPAPAFAPAPVVQPVQCPAPAPVLQCPQPAPVVAPVAQPVCPASGEVIYK